MTGQWAHCSGRLGLAHRGFSLADPRRHLARVQADAGYHTVLAGIQHVGKDDDELGTSRLQGRSIMPLVRREAEEINEAVFAEVTYHAAYEPQRAVRTRRWKYIRRFEERAGPVLPNCDDSHSKQYLLERGWRERAPEPEQLYDLVFDPNEARNLAADPGSAGALDGMRRRLDRWMQETGDPLLSGPVPAPAGARINDEDGLSPGETPRLIE